MALKDFGRRNKTNLELLGKGPVNWRDQGDILWLTD
jgi:hypothetical protein